MYLYLKLLTLINLFYLSYSKFHLIFASNFNLQRLLIFRKWAITDKGHLFTLNFQALSILIESKSFIFEYQKTVFS